METITKTMKKRYLRRGFIYVLTYSLILNAWLPAVLAEVVLQQDGVKNGNIIVSPLTDGIQNMTASNGAIGHFSDFDIAAGDFVNCVQPSANANALFRVYSGDGTQILGRFDATGNIYLINPAGILFGANSQINVNRLVASSLDIENQDFLDGRYEFVAGGGDVGAVINNGSIIAAEGVALVGRKVLNTGNIQTGAEGFVVMAAGDRVLLGEPGSNIVVEMDSVELPGDGIGDVINDGDIESSSGTVVLAAGDIFSSALELPKVSSGIGRVEQNGTIRVDDTIGDGGGISLTAADEVILAAGSLTTANAGTDGDSGLVVAHSKGQITVQAGAQIEAIGGHIPHDIIDDFDDVVETSVEISGDFVNFAGDVDASALYGKRGKIIIDALDMTIADGSMPEAPLDNTVYEKWIEQQSYASTDVELVAHAKTGGNIVAEPIIDGVIEGGSGDIVLRTKYDTGGIEFMPGPDGDRTAIHTTEGGNVYMLAGGDDPDTTDVIEGGIAIGDIISFVPQHAPEEWIVEPGKIRLLTTNYGNITTGQLSVDGGSYDEISVIASGDLLINGDVTTYAHQVDEDLEVSQARTCLVSEHGNVEINGIVTVEAHAKYESTADIHIDAGRDVSIDLGGGQILATALTSAEGTANASVLIHAGKEMGPSGKGNITITNPKSADKAIYLRAQTQGSKAEIYSDGKASVKKEISDGEAHVKLEIIADAWLSQCPDCPTPPGLVPPLKPWEFTTHMGDPIIGNVLEDLTGLEIIPESWDPKTAYGTLNIDEDGTYKYTPKDGFVGQDRFIYKAKVTDTGVETDLVEVTINVTNELPVADSSAISEHMGIDIENKPLIYSDVSDELGIIDKDLTVNIVTDPLYGDVTLQWDETNEIWTYTYVPKDNGEGHFVGTVSFEYTVTDPQGVVGDSGTAQVKITMTNDPPVLADDTSNTHMGDPVNVDVLANDVDINGDSLSVALVGGTSTEHGQLTPNEDGSFTYTPSAGYVGNDSFTYEATDGELGESGEPVVFTALATITVGNSPPNPVDDTATTDAGEPVGGNVLANDIDTDNDPLSVVLNGTSPQHGQLELNEDGAFTYVPDEGFDGQDSFTYLVTDGQLGGEPAGATVTVTVNPGEEPPLPPPPAIRYIAPAPGLERVEFEISGCPALVKWAATELGIDERVMQIWTVNALASSQDIQPCDACEKLKQAAAILRDDGGARIAALAQVIDELASNTAPPSPEQMASVADVISRNSQANNHYAVAGEYLDALVAYVGVLNSDLNFSTEESIMFAADKYVAPLAENENTGLIAYIAARLAALGGS